VSTHHDWIADAVSGLAPLVTISEAGAVLRTSVRNMRRIVSAGRLASLKQCEGGSSRVLIPRAELERYLRSLQP